MVIASAVVLDCSLVELFKENSVVPSRLDRRDLICCLLRYILGVHSLRHFHDFKRVGLHEKGKSIATHACAR